jgi:hypothetical protein
MKLGNITQVIMTARKAHISGVFGEGQGWFAEWADASPRDSVYVYYIGETKIGFVYGEPADFETLVDFENQYHDAEELRCLAREFEL